MSSATESDLKGEQWDAGYANYRQRLAFALESISFHSSFPVKLCTLMTNHNFRDHTGWMLVVKDHVVWQLVV